MQICGFLSVYNHVVEFQENSQNVGSERDSGDDLLCVLHIAFGGTGSIIVQ